MNAVQGYVKNNFMEKIIQYFDQPAKVSCDENCKKAWGISNRPKIQLSEDEDNVVWLADSELDEAPDNPGTYEGGHAKPTRKSEIPNKWCVRECERCAMSKPGQSNDSLPPKDWTQRVYNLESCLF